MKSLFTSLSKQEKYLYIISLVIVSLSCLLSPMQSPLLCISCIVGVSALLFVGKGYVIGQLLTAFFALLYGLVSFEMHYYGEMITYVGMSAPIALMSAYEWYKHPFKHGKEVEIRTLTLKDIIIMSIYSILVTIFFYFILKHLHTSELMVSTISITTSFLACYLTYLRSPYYAIAYACNDIVLIVLWVLASIQDMSYIPMIFCFLMFLVNDLYGYLSWKKRMKLQYLDNDN